MQFSEDALKFINLGINSEIAAYVFYKHAGAIVKEKALQDTLHKLANDEKGHFLSLEDLYDRNVLKDPASLSEMLRLVGGRRDVPVVLEGGKATVGYGGS